MQCRSPYYHPQYRQFFPCNTCLDCRIDRRRVWTTRLVLESLEHANVSYVTLTYNDENLPENGYLKKNDLQGFFKRLRYYVPDVRLRYFACGEYGEQSLRPHYHAIIFGLDPVSGYDRCCDSWTYGFVQCVPSTLEAVKYVAGYVTKKLVHTTGDYSAPPEFILTSRRPGIAYSAVAKLALAGLQNGDVPKSVMFGGKPYPLGRYMTAKLRELMLSPEDLERLKLAVIWQRYNELQMLVEKHFGKFSYRQGREAEAYNLEHSPKWASVEAKHKIFSSRSGI